MRQLELRQEELSFHEAARKGNLARVKELLESGFNIHAGNDFADPAIDLAAEAGKLEVVSYLLDKGAKSPNLLLSACLCEDALIAVKIIELIQKKELFDITHVHAALSDQIFFEGNEKIYSMDEYGFMASFYELFNTYAPESSLSKETVKSINTLMSNSDLNDKTRRICLSRLSKLLDVRLENIFDGDLERVTNFFAQFSFEAINKCFKGLTKTLDSDKRILASILSSRRLEAGTEARGKKLDEAICMYESLRQQSDDDKRRMKLIYDWILEVPEQFEDGETYDEYEDALHCWNERDCIFRSIKGKTEKDYQDYCQNLERLMVYYSHKKNFQVAMKLNAYALNIIIDYKIDDTSNHLEKLANLTRCRVKRVGWPDSNSILHKTLSWYLDHYDLLKNRNAGQRFEIMEIGTVGDFSPFHDVIVDRELLEIYTSTIAIFPLTSFSYPEADPAEAEADPIEVKVNDEVTAWENTMKYLKAADIKRNDDQHMALNLLCKVVEKALSQEHVEKLELSGFPRSFPKKEDHKIILALVQKLKARLSSLESMSTAAAINCFRNLQTRNSELEKKNAELEQTVKKLELQLKRGREDEVGQKGDKTPRKTCKVSELWSGKGAKETENSNNPLSQLKFN